MQLNKSRAFSATFSAFSAFPLATFLAIVVVPFVVVRVVFVYKFTYTTLFG